MSDIISEAFDMRGNSDYDDFYVISKEKVKEQIENAEYFYNQVSNYIIKTTK